jgi:hypothetical protein
MLKPSRDPWVPWATFSPFLTVGPETTVADSAGEQHSAAPTLRALLWVREPDGIVRRVPLPAAR